VRDDPRAGIRALTPLGSLAELSADQACQHQDLECPWQEGLRIVIKLVVASLDQMTQVELTGLSQPARWGVCDGASKGARLIGPRTGIATHTMCRAPIAEPM